MWSFHVDGRAARQSEMNAELIAEERLPLDARVEFIPAPGRKVGDVVEFGGLLGKAPVMALHPWSSAAFVGRGGRIPAPLQGLGN